MIGHPGTFMSAKYTFFISIVFLFFGVVERGEGLVSLNMFMIFLISVSNFAYNMFKIIESVFTVMS